MKQKTSMAWTLGVTTLLVLSTASPVLAESDTPRIDDVSAIRAVAPGSLESVVPDAGIGVDSVDAEGGAVLVSVPSDPLSGISVDSGPRVTVGLPFAAEADDAASIGDGFVGYDNGNGTSSVPVVHRDGAAQVLTVIDDAIAPTEFRYPVGLPSGDRLVEDEDGGGARIVDSAGETVGVFAAPWATDATGRSVSTHYSIDANELVQTVDHRVSGIVYPVVADPTYKTYTFYYSRSDVESVYAGIQNINNVCKWIPLPYLASIGCSAPGNFEDAILSAHYRKRRVKAPYHECGYTYCNYYTYSVVV